MSRASVFVSLADAAAQDPARFGGKAAALARAVAAGLPVPAGCALPWDAAAALASDPAAAAQAFAALAETLGDALAVRSSAVGEDGDAASFAGQHLTRLNVVGAAAAARALAEVVASAASESALAYRARLGLPGAPRMAIVVQRLVPAEVAGVLFTRHPVSGADERYVEAAWGLGEAVVAGLVTPDSYRVARGGRVLEARPGAKEVAVRPRAGGGTEEAETDDTRGATVRALTDAQLAALERLAGDCERVFDGPRDLEWAFARDELALLQCRRITR